MGDKVNFVPTLQPSATLSQVISWLNKFAQKVQSASGRNLIQNVNASGAALSNLSNASAGQVPYFTGPTTVTLADVSLNVTAYGADPTGLTDSTAAINSAIAAIPAGGGSLYFPSGTYLISSTLAIPSNTTVFGDGWGSTIKGASTFTAYPPWTTATSSNGYFLISNSTYTGSPGNSNIVVRDLNFDFTANSNSGVHCVLWRNVTHVHVTACRFIGGNDGHATTASSDYSIQGCHAINQTNCGIDQWDGCTDGTIANNVVDCGSNANSYGIIVTGETTSHGANTSKRVSVVGNIVRNAGQVGIWFEGGSGGTGSTQDCVATGNTVDTCGSAGMRLSECLRCIVSSNIVTNSHAEAILNAAESTSAGVNCIITDNLINNASTAGSGSFAAIHLENTAAGCIVSDNDVQGSNHKYQVLLEGGATGNIVVNNFGAAGTLGTISNSGGTTNQAARQIAGLLAFTLTGVNFNSANTDNVFTIGCGTARYQIDSAVISNASHSLTTATVSMWSGAGATGINFVTSVTCTIVNTGSDNVNTMQALTIASGGTISYNDGTLYFRIGTAEGVAATADVTLFLRPLT